MKSGARSLIFLALFICNNSLATWDSSSWPSESSYRIATPTNYLTATNFSAKKHVDVWSQFSTTNFIPITTNATPNGWDNLISSPALDVDNTNATHTFTNTYWTDAQVSPSTSITFNWTSTNYYTNSQTFMHEDVTNYLTNILFAVTSIDSIPWKFDVQWMWEFDTQQALQERWRILNGTNDFQETAPTTIKPSLFKSRRDNLVGYKSFINSSLSNFVDKGAASSNGNFDSYFSTPSSSLWANVSITSNANWTWTNIYIPEEFPRLSVQSLIDNVSGFPYTETTQIVTNDVEGWFAGSNGVETVSNYVYTTTNFSTKWFTYTPFRDWGGWGPGVSNPQPFVLEIPIDFLTTGSNNYTATDACSNSIPYYTTAVTNTNGIITDMTLVLHYDNTNLLSSFSFTNATTHTNSGTCTNDFLDVGFTEADYGYKHMKAVLNLMAWTVQEDGYTCKDDQATNTFGLCAHAGRWSGGTNVCTASDLPAVDFTRNTNTGCGSLPWAYKVALKLNLTNDNINGPDAPISPTNSFYPPWYGKDQYPGAIYEWWGPDNVSACGDEELTFSGIFTRACHSTIDQTKWPLLGYECKCISGPSGCDYYQVNNFIPLYFTECLPPEWGGPVDVGDDGPGSPLDPPGGCPDLYWSYKYGRNAQTVEWFDIPGELASTRVEYYKFGVLIHDSTNAMPVAESGMGNMSWFMSEYETGTTSSNSSHTQSDFCLNTKPWSGTTTEVKSWAMGDAQLLLKWDVAGGLSFTD